MFVTDNALGTPCHGHKYVLYANYTIVNRYSFSGRHKSYNNELYYIGILLISKFKDTIFSTL